jgi:hypothetical protein
MLKKQVNNAKFQYTHLPSQPTHNALFYMRVKTKRTLSPKQMLAAAAAIFGSAPPAYYMFKNKNTKRISLLVKYELN